MAAGRILALQEPNREQVYSTGIETSKFHRKELVRIRVVICHTSAYIGASVQPTSKAGFLVQQRSNMMARILPMCELCRRVYDDKHPIGEKPWIEVQRYLSRYILRASEVEFSSAYCSDCQDSCRLLTTYGNHPDIAPYRLP